MNYHDFVIKDGVFVGKFEEMYKSFDDPWGQKVDVIQNYQKMACLSSIKRLNPKKGLRSDVVWAIIQIFFPKCFLIFKLMEWTFQKQP